MPEIPDEKFKSEVMKFIEVANQKFDGLVSDVRTNTYKLDKLENDVRRVSEQVSSTASDVRVLSGQFQDVASLTMKDHSRVDNLEKRVEDLESGIH